MALLVTLFLVLRAYLLLLLLVMAFSIADRWAFTWVSCFVFSAALLLVEWVGVNSIDILLLEISQTCTNKSLHVRKGTEAAGNIPTNFEAMPQRLSTRSTRIIAASLIRDQCGWEPLQLLLLPSLLLFPHSRGFHHRPFGIVAGGPGGQG